MPRTAMMLVGGVLGALLGLVIPIGLIILAALSDFLYDGGADLEWIVVYGFCCLFLTVPTGIALGAYAGSIVAEFTTPFPPPGGPEAADRECDHDGRAEDDIIS